SYRSHVIEVGDNEFAYIMSPFFECISIAGYKDGECGNCLFKCEGYKCSYSKAADNPDLPSSKFAAYRSSSLARYPTLRNKNKEALPGLPPRKLNHTSYPRKQQLEIDRETLDLLKADQDKEWREQMEKRFAPSRSKVAVRRQPDVKGKGKAED